MSWTYGTRSNYVEIPSPLNWETPCQTPKCFNTTWTDPDFGHQKYIRYKDDFTIAENVETRIKYPFTNEWRPRTAIVYFANLWACPHSPSMGIELVVKQLKDLETLHIVQQNNVKLYLVVCGPPISEPICREEFKKLEMEYELMYNYENSHEYLGALRVWECQKQYDIVLYFHSKGMSRYRGGGREPQERGLFDRVIRPWKHVFWIFENFPDIEKVGISCSEKGWIWHTVYWTRGTYLQTVEKPVRTSRRHYYEDWIARQIKNEKDMYPEEEYPFTSDRYRSTYCQCWNLAASSVSNFANIGSYRQPYNCLK